MRIPIARWPFELSAQLENAGMVLAGNLAVFYVRIGLIFPRIWFRCLRIRSKKAMSGKHAAI
jgi:hypothetical protein